jgi:hypothetical protein
VVRVVCGVVCGVVRVVWRCENVCSACGVVVCAWCGRCGVVHVLCERGACVCVEWGGVVRCVCVWEGVWQVICSTREAVLRQFLLICC